MTALGLLHLLNETDKPIVYVTISDGNADTYMIRGNAEIIQIDWDWIYEGDPDADDIRGVIADVERRWPDDTDTNQRWPMKRSVLADLREKLRELTGEDEEADE
jgi:hypothetical protein